MSIKYYSKPLKGLLTYYYLFRGFVVWSYRPVFIALQFEVIALPKTFVMRWYQSFHRTLKTCPLQALRLSGGRKKGMFHFPLRLPFWLLCLTSLSVCFRTLSTCKYRDKFRYIYRCKQNVYSKPQIIFRRICGIFVNSW